MKRLFLIFLFLLIACPAWGATKTVCAEGCDYTTLAEAEAGASTGDTVNVSTGTYSQDGITFTKGIAWVAIDGDGTVTVTRSTSGAQTVIVATGETSTSFRGFVFDGTTNTTTSVVHLQNGANNKTFDNCTFKSTGGTPTQLFYLPGKSTGIVLKNPTFTGEPISAGITSGINSRSEIILRDIAVSSFTSSRLIYGGFALLNIEGGLITASVSDSLIYVSNLRGSSTVSGLTTVLSANGTAPKSFILLSIPEASTAEISNNTISYNATNSLASVIDINGAAATAGTVVSVTDNAISITSEDQAYPAIDVVNVSTPIISRNKIDFVGTTQSITGVIIVTSSRTSTPYVAYNTVASSQTAKQVILIGSDTSTGGNNYLDGAIIIGNNVSALLNHGSVHGIEYGYNKNGIIAGNYVYGGGYGIVIKGDETYTNGGVFYNTFIDQTKESLRVKGVKNLPVYNNTFYLSSGRTITNGHLYITVNPESANVTSTGTIVKNNIFSTQSGQYTINCDANSSTGLIVDYNIHYPFKAIVGATTYTDWETWQASYDSHGLNSDPLFISATNYHLQSGSPAKGAGVNVGLSNTNPPDIGAEPYKQYVPWVK